MNLILLPGMNPATKEWLGEVEAAVAPGFDTTSRQDYLHWVDGEDMSVAEEAFRLGDIARKLEGPYSIFAKSAGTWVVLQAVRSRLIMPDRCVFAGTAVNFAREADFPIEDLLKGFSVPTRFVQKEGDPAIGAEDLRVLLHGLHVANAEVVPIPGNDHHYENVAQLGELITSFAGEAAA